MIETGSGLMNARLKRALETLAGCPDGATLSALQGQGIKDWALVRLVDDGLARSEEQRYFTSRNQFVTVLRFHITDAGREALK